MGRTYTQIRDLIEQILQDTGNATWSTDELDLLIPMALTEVSSVCPRLVRSILTTTASSRRLVLPANTLRNLLWIDKAEYPVAQDPPYYRNVQRFGNMIEIEIDDAPLSAASLYLHLAKKHVLLTTLGTTDTAGAVKTAGSEGDTTLALKSLGTGTIEQDAILTIAGDTFEYTVTAQATIAANEATVSIEPGLSADVAADAVVTLSDSSLDVDMENVLAGISAGIASINKATSDIGGISVGSANTPAQREQWGMLKLEDARARLKTMAYKRIAYDYPKD